MPGELRRYSVAEGELLTEGQRLCTIESMKMEVVLSCPPKLSGHRVKALPCRVRSDKAAGQLLSPGDLLLEVQPRP